MAPPHILLTTHRANKADVSERPPNTVYLWLTHTSTLHSHDDIQKGVNRFVLGAIREQIF